MLSNPQVRHLRSLAHHLDAMLQTGDKGLTEAVQKEISIALSAHELIKVKLNAERDERAAMTDEIVAWQQCELVQSIGKTIVLYKHNSKAPKITLPKA
ncbi:YhbY family RNA-binding protein [Ostreibacterium oceani]|uniref:Ribosome assembly RNA-binding protein YhbY n=1 Tax=Ostreibacterium oceani TaxID=2654998 RepID=A0A6N7EU03_9GAMM|nr:YhbY family RNA-binding protein [Ostreibacterium oceani]MPV86304.1 ribosome assembly RNA-binding protein YhbY [Ostreibacterium oceani]